MAQDPRSFGRAIARCWCPRWSPSRSRPLHTRTRFLSQVLDAAWIKVDRSDDIEYLVTHARYTSRLASGAKNLGECGVLALAEVRGHTAVVDDRVAREVGKEHGVQITGTLALMCDGIRQGLLTVPLVSKIADDLLATDYRLPVGPGYFESWAREQGWI